MALTTWNVLWCPFSSVRRKPDGQNYYLLTRLKMKDFFIFTFLLNEFVVPTTWNVFMCIVLTILDKNYTRFMFRGQKEVKTFFVFCKGFHLYKILTILLSRFLRLGMSFIMHFMDFVKEN